jgi:hypothetical protein
MPREPVRTFTAAKLRAALFDPQPVQVGPTPSEYAEIDMRTSKRWPQSWQT